MASTNKDAMDLFPKPEEIPGLIKRQQAIFLLARTLEATRGALDQITEGAERVLSEEEQIEVGQGSEAVAKLAGTIATWHSA